MLGRVISKYFFCVESKFRIGPLCQDCVGIRQIDGIIIEEFWIRTIWSALFSFYIADVEEYKRRGQNGDIVVGRKNFVMLAYADDLSLVAKAEEEMKVVLKRFKVEKKNIELNAGK